MMYYSKSTKGFYTKDIHGDNIPAEAVEVSIDDYNALMEGQSNGMMIVPNDNGHPMLVAQEIVEPVQPTKEQLLAQLQALQTQIESLA